ncbi:Dolichyl-phosphate-mannose-protein mannosyltransferase-domain-containing protein [Kickxella alabastrina]|nr:Dolichyl-phosphate-mannose-protein mannosyltransferase-domain-containing protein [Kickxella alabastrina]KAI7829241.1 Dolichyl-phosphate-mannose-protein mannosyltransferase-domain-containing protein [Kickxella alabastrina]
MAHLESMRYRKQPGATAIYEDATVISGISTGSAGTTPTVDNANGLYGDAGPPNGAGVLYGYEKKDLDYSSQSAGAIGGVGDTSNSSDRYPRFNVSRSQWITLGLIVILAAYVRLWRLSNPANVVFDEVHFGKFAGKYLNGTYFFDVHPPLAKMMFAAAGKMAGYDGVFDFKSIGLDYVAAGVPYVGMRLMPALLGLAMVPITYVTLAALGHAGDACAVGALLIAFENALLTQSRLILLDAALIFFTGLTVMFWALFFTEARRPFGRRWWAYLLLAGANMGNALSCKWVGLFLVATLGVWTIKDLWEKLGDLSITPSQYAKHFIARAVALIAVPLCVYLFWFQVHFSLLHRSGDGNAFMSPEFQNTLDGVSLGHTPRDIYYGSRVRIRHDATNAGYLHSHLSNYETGSKQQQVTLYGFRDDNNYWVLTRTEAAEAKHANSSDPTALQQIKHGDIVRLLHWKTFRRLHSHDERPPVTTNDYQNEVTGYGWEGFKGDSNDHWRVQIIEGDSAEPDSKTKLMAIYSRFRLIHTGRRCALFSNRRKLPKWATSRSRSPTLWRIETNVNAAIPAGAPLAEYRRPGLVAKVLEATAIMWRVNNGLTKSHPYESRPHTWPWMRRGMAFWGEANRTIYLLGTPILWWLSLVAVLLFAALQAAMFLRSCRGINDRLMGARERYAESVGFLAAAWVLHWVPFFLMGRQLFLHHYLPAMWLAVLALTATLDLFTRRMGRRMRQVIMGALVLVVVRSYFQYSHLAYGTPWTRQGCERSKWLKAWDYDCKRYPGADASPKPVVPVAGPVVPTIVADVGPPDAQNFDPLENENKLNEPAPRIDHDKLNSNANKLHLEMVKAATTAGVAAPVDAHENEDVVGEDAHHDDTLVMAPVPPHF